MKKPTRKKRPAVSTLAPKKNAKAGGVARKPRQPARAMDSRREVVPLCPEFSLWEEIQIVPADPAGYAAFCERTGRTPKASATRERRVKVLRVESSPKVERALVLSLMRINNTPGAAERERMRLALWNLMLLAGGRCPFGSDWDDFRDQLLDDLAKTIGKTLLDALGPGFNWQDEKERKAAGKKARIDDASKKAGRTLDRAVADVETAVMQLARFRANLPLPGDNSPGAWTWMIQRTAKEIFRETRERPTKSEICQRLKAEGWDFTSNDPARDWARVFANAGLESLPS